jgi:hypothetical protein
MKLKTCKRFVNISLQFLQGRICMEQQVTEPTIKRLKPRALVLMADQKDLKKIKDFIETLVDVKLVYLTTASSNIALRVIKEPRDKRQPFEQALYTLDVEN